MILFYAEKIEGEWAYLSTEESQHLLKVLRKKEGDQIDFVDGNGFWYQGTLFESNKKGSKLMITEKKQEAPQNIKLHLAIAPTKNIARYEWFLEKACEIGIHEITPILCFHSERRRIREDRLQKILVSAMKQSLKAYLPKLNPLVDIKSFLSQHSTQETKTAKYFAYLQPDVKSALKDNYSKEKDVIIMIGPEGGFSDQEAQLAKECGFDWVSLGPHRLRTETAGIVAVHTINLLNE